ncbi:MAG: PilZ domain-containing protein [Deltaproteobacteria bacterium]|nr:PilZ domain-containing protein [Deltaproteobacteria bacterium]MBW2394693.1 PilZ domain-containing protein [Deltaproteobacteria bacterium]
MGVEAQRFPRFKKRVPCRVTVSGASTAAIVLNVSQAGLFVQTGATAKPGDQITIRLSPAHTSEPIAIDAKVIWRRTVASHLRTIVKGGMGLSIHNAPSSYFEFLTGALPIATAPSRPDAKAAAAGTSEKTFLMRVRQEGGPRTRKLYVQAIDPDDASRRVLARFGSGWTVILAEEA